MHFIGVDLPKQTISVCVLVREAGRQRVIARRSLRCDQPEQIRAFFSKLTPFQMTVEATSATSGSACADASRNIHAYAARNRGQFQGAPRKSRKLPGWAGKKRGLLNRKCLRPPCHSIILDCKVVISQNSGKRKQFSLKFAMAVVTVACALLAAIALNARVMLPAICIASFIGIEAVALRALYYRLHQNEASHAFPLASGLLFSSATWIILAIAVAAIVAPPGGSGPIQYSAGNEHASFVFGLRVATVITMLASPFVCGAIGVARSMPGVTCRLGYVMVSIGWYICAWIVLLFNPQFFPMV